jgi:nicotinamidase-related amidase
MTIEDNTAALTFGSDDLRLLDELRAAVRSHLAAISHPRNRCQGGAVDSVVEAACDLLQAARAAKIPIFFTTRDFDPSMPPSPHDKKVRMDLTGLAAQAWLGADTLIVAGVITSHCIYATCRDATDSFRVVVPREAVGERCDIMHEVNLLDIDLDLGDVLPLNNVLAYLDIDTFRQEQTRARSAG